ncbi:MAG: hypothetical protein HC860_11095 [Alkalinema sp. RU_4_3]|nr:hypothetical protein [Alkalinema sp. RU_4_3]
MLKLTYTEEGLNMEHLRAMVETVVTQRTLLALRLGKALCIQPGTASFLLPIGAVDLKQFKAMLHGEQARSIEICAVDSEFYEVSIRGVWLANGNDAHEGMFVAAAQDKTEFFVHKLWLASQAVGSMIQG